MTMEKEIKVIETHRKVAGYYKPARLLLESLYSEKWGVIKRKLDKVLDPEHDPYYMIGVNELAKRVKSLNIK